MKSPLLTSRQQDCPGLSAVKERLEPASWRKRRDRDFATDIDQADRKNREYEGRCDAQEMPSPRTDRRYGEEESARPRGLPLSSGNQSPESAPGADLDSSQDLPSGGAESPADESMVFQSSESSAKASPLAAPLGNAPHANTQTLSGKAPVSTLSAAPERGRNVAEVVAAPSVNSESGVSDAGGTSAAASSTTATSGANVPVITNKNSLTQSMLGTESAVVGVSAESEQLGGAPGEFDATSSRQQSGGPALDAQVASSSHLALQSSPETVGVVAPLPAFRTQLQSVPAKLETAPGTDSQLAAPTQVGGPAIRTSTIGGSSDTLPAPMLTDGSSLKDEPIVRSAMALHRVGGGAMTLRLDPANLGALRINVRIDGDRVSLQFQAESVQARHLIVESLDSLGRSLADQGLRVENMSVQSLLRSPDLPSSSSSGQALQDKGQQAGGGGGFKDAADGQSRGRQDSSPGNDPRKQQFGHSQLNVSRKFTLNPRQFNTSPIRGRF